MHKFPAGRHIRQCKLSSVSLSASPVGGNYPQTTRGVCVCMAAVTSGDAAARRGPGVRPVGSGGERRGPPPEDALTAGRRSRAAAAAAPRNAR